MNESHHRLDFRLEQIINEEHKPQQTYAVRFCDVISAYHNTFASVGGNCASIYSIDLNGIHFRQAYLDEDIEEVYFCCCWGSTSGGFPLLIVSGLRGILKAINCRTFELEVILVGHGNSVNDLRIHPVDENLVFSASKDESIRLWNLKTAGWCLSEFLNLFCHILCVCQCVLLYLRVNVVTVTKFSLLIRILWETHFCLLAWTPGETRLFSTDHFFNY